MLNIMSKKISGLKQIIPKYTNYLFDLDGVIWLGDKQIDGSIQMLKQLQKQNKNIFYITNNSTRSRQEVREKFLKFDFDPKIDNIYSSCYFSGLYIRQKYPQINKLLVTGTKSMVSEIAKLGFDILHLQTVDQKLSFQELLQNHIDPSREALLIGYDSNFNYKKLCLLSLYVQKGVKFFSTNPDKATMMMGYRMPGCGSMVKSIQVSSNKQSQVIGKPNPFVLQYLMQKIGIKRQESVMIGDNLQTDIMFASQLGVHTVCTLSGVSNEELVLNNKLVIPTYYCDSI